MRFARLSVYLERKPNGKIDWFSGFGHFKSACKCHFFTIGPVCFEYLGRYCAFDDETDLEVE